MDSHPDCRLLTLADVEPAAQVIAQAFIDDPLCAFMLPNRKTRVKTLLVFFRAMGEAGVTKCLELIQAELDVSMALCGRSNLAEVDRSILVPETIPT